MRFQVVTAVNEDLCLLGWKQYTDISQHPVACRTLIMHIAGFSKTSLYLRQTVRDLTPEDSNPYLNKSVGIELSFTSHEKLSR